MADVLTLARVSPAGPDLALPGCTVRLERGLGVAKLQIIGPDSDVDFRARTGEAAPAPGRQVHAGGLTFAWLAPAEWLICGLEAQVAKWTAQIEATGSDDVLAIDLTHARATFIVAGVEARNLLAAHCPLDLVDTRFAVDDVARSLLGDAGVFIARLPDDGDGVRFRIITDQTMGDYALRMLAGPRPRTGSFQ